MRRLWGLMRKGLNSGELEKWRMWRKEKEKAVNGKQECPSPTHKSWVYIGTGETTRESMDGERSNRRENEFELYIACTPVTNNPLVRSIARYISASYQLPTYLPTYLVYSASFGLLWLEEASSSFCLLLYAYLSTSGWKQIKTFLLNFSEISFVRCMARRFFCLSFDFILVKFVI